MLGSPGGRSNDEMELAVELTGISTEADDHEPEDVDELEFEFDDDKSDTSNLKAATTAISKHKAPVVKDEPNKAPKTSSERSKKGKVKAKSLVEKYTEVVELEELTAQKRAEADKAKSAVEAARIKVKGEILLEREQCKTAKLQLKAELLVMKKLKMEHEMVMERQQMHGGGLRGNYGGSSSTHQNTGSDLYLPETPQHSDHNYSRSSSTFSFESHSDNNFFKPDYAQ